MRKMKTGFADKSSGTDSRITERFSGPLKRYAVYNFHDAIKCAAFDWFLRIGLFPFWYLRRLNKNRPLPKEKPERMLILRPDGLGDVILIVPMLRALRSIFPETQIVLCTSTTATDLIHGNPYGVDLLAIDLPWFSGQPTTLGKLFEVAARIRSLKFDIVFDPRGDIRNILLVFLAGIPHRIGTALTGGEYMLTDVVRLEGDEDLVARNLKLAEVLSEAQEIQDNGILQVWIKERGDVEVKNFLMN